MEKIKAILFDLGKVLVGYDVHALEDRYSAYGLLREGVMSDYMMRSEAGSAFMEGRMNSAAFYEAALRFFDLEITYDEFYRIWNGMFYPYPEMEKLVRGVKEAHPELVLVLISDTNEAHFDFLLSRYGFLKLLDRFVLSYKVGRMKPHPGIYEKAVEVSGAPRVGVFYVDDRPDLVKAASALGINSFCFTSCGKLKEKLLTLGVKT